MFENAVKTLKTPYCCALFGFLARNVLNNHKTRHNLPKLDESV